MTPAFNHFLSTVLSMRTLRSSQSWLMWSKHPLMSASSTHWAEAVWDRETNNWLMASWVERLIRKP